MRSILNQRDVGRRAGMGRCTMTREHRLRRIDNGEEKGSKTRDEELRNDDEDVLDTLETD